jgi:uncharacterized protein
MRIRGEQRFDHPRETVWEALMDPEVLAGTLPGCERLERVDDGSFEGRLRVSVGPVRGEFRGKLVMTERVPPESYRMQLDGRGPNGFMTGEGTVRLEEDEEDGGTVLSYDLEAQVGGRIAGLGQRLLESTGKAVAQQGLEGLERQLAALHGGAARQEEEQIGRRAMEEAAPAAAPPSQIEFAAGVARQVVRDLVPPESRRFALAGACFLGGLLLGFWMGGRRR